MAVTIDGDGTITGVSVGGLPDGIVDTDMIAADAVTDAKQSLTGVAKAWINFNGENTPTARESYNVSSITDNATGNYTLNFTNAMSSADFAYTFAVGDGNHATANRALNYISSTTTSLQILAESSNGGNTDEPNICVAIFGA